MSKRAGPSHSISGVFVFLLLGMFAVFSTVMVLLGAKAYKGTADRAAEHNAQRLASAYVRSMVRSDDQRQAVSVETVDDICTITLRSVYDEEEYLTRLYVYEGKLREWFSYGEAVFQPEFGEEVCAAEEMQALFADGLLKVRLRCGGDWTSVDIALRCGAN